MSETQLKKNTQALEAVELQLRKQNSLPQSFLRGFLTALGATVGLSLFLGVLAVVLNAIARSLGLESLFDPILQSLQGTR